MKETNTPARFRAWLGIITLIVVVANIFLFAFRLISALTFWIIIVIAAIIAWPVMNSLKKQDEQKKEKKK